MCVIAVCISKLPTLEELRQMESHNRDGGSVAWIEGDRVNWVKGRKSKKLFELASRVPLPVVFHFRIATVGGNNKLLCHPFPTTPEAELFEAGTAPRVLFHNGHQFNWELWGRIAGVKLKGPVSDTRMLAAITGKNGDPGWLKDATGCFAVMDKTSVLRLGNFTEQDGIFYSNIYWKHSAYSSTTSPDRGWPDYDGDDYYSPWECGHRTGFHGGTRTNGHLKTCNCQSCVNLDFYNRRSHAVQTQTEFPRTGLAGKSNANHPTTCTCIDCRIDALSVGTRQHRALCKCHDCELLTSLWKIRDDIRTPPVAPKPHEKDCQCRFCLEEREPKTVAVKDENHTERETVAVTVRLPHGPECDCMACHNELVDLAEKAGVTIQADGHITVLGHKTDCQCRICKILNVEFEALPSEAGPAGERPLGHGDDCRCQMCRAAIDNQILADQARALEKQAEEHLDAQGDNGEMLAGQDMGGSVEHPGKGTTLE